MAMVNEIAPAPVRSISKARALADLKYWPTVFFLLAHMPLAVGMKIIGGVGTAHALLTALVGVTLALTSRRAMTTAYVGAYIVGAEVLWRMTKAQVFWEYGKYLTAALFFLAMLRTGRLRLPPLPSMYFLALLPSTMMTLFEYDWESGRRLVSGNMSGPFALAVCACFFNKLKFSREDRLRLFISLMGPIVAVASIALYSTLTASSLNFTNNSNFVTSGGFGPNQVSSTLGLGVLAGFLFIMDDTPLKFKLIIMGLVGLFLVQSALTFSRTGLYIAAASSLLASYYLFRDRGTRLKLVMMFGSVLFVGAVIVVPRLNSFTGGALSERYKNTGNTNRDHIAAEDFRMWMENPVLGVGAGKGTFYREYAHGVAVAHTEFSRLVAEHGLFGLFACVLLFVMARNNLARTNSTKGKAVVAGVVGWSFLFMLTTGMRLSAPSFVFGLSFGNFSPARKAVPNPATSMLPTASRSTAALSQASGHPAS